MTEKGADPTKRNRDLPGMEVDEESASHVSLNDDISYSPRTKPQGKKRMSTKKPNVTLALKKRVTKKGKRQAQRRNQTRQNRRLTPNRDREKAMGEKKTDSIKESQDKVESLTTKEDRRKPAEKAEDWQQTGNKDEKNKKSIDKATKGAEKPGLIQKTITEFLATTATAQDKKERKHDGLKKRVTGSEATSIKENESSPSAGEQEIEKNAEGKDSHKLKLL